MNQRTEQIFNEPCKIGFMQPFPVKGEPLVTKTYNLFCRSIPQRFRLFVRFCGRADDRLECSS